jgi:glycosyltransferase involved in cell wall biosynthesis
MRFSVIIPCFNYGRYLGRAIDSALEQEGVDREVIVVDDGSTDDTAAVVRAYADRIIGMRQDNRGPGAARNRGIDAAGAVGPGDRRRPRPAPRLGADRRANFAAYVAGRTGIANGACAYRREVFDALRFPEDIRNNEDMLVEALTLARFDCAALDAPLAEIHAHPGSQRENIDTIRDAGSRVVDMIFDHPALPAGLADLRSVFLSQHLLARSRAHYRAGEYEEAMRLYREAIGVRPGNVVRLSYLRKFVRSAIRQRLAGRRSTVVGRR